MKKKISSHLLFHLTYSLTRHLACSTEEHSCFVGGFAHFSIFFLLQLVLIIMRQMKKNPLTFFPTISVPLHHQNNKLDIRHLHNRTTYIKVERMCVSMPFFHLWWFFFLCEYFLCIFFLRCTATMMMMMMVKKWNVYFWGRIKKVVMKKWKSEAFNWWTGDEIFAVIFWGFRLLFEE